MRNIVPDIIICLIILVTLVAVHTLCLILYETLGGAAVGPNLSQIVQHDTGPFGWLLRLIVNCFGYACVFVPLFFIYKYTAKVKYVERASGWLVRTIRLCYTSGGERVDRQAGGKSETTQSTTEEVFLFCYYFAGLMLSYLTWGVLQEKIMTREYVDADGKTMRHFTDSQFLVFVNRTLALVLATLYLTWRGDNQHTAPLFKYSYASFSNIMSAWCQYEALKFVNFPTQVLAKSTKIIPVMLMGRIISRTRYEFHEYLTAGFISVGMVLFLTGSADESKQTASTTITGIFLLTLYLVFDSFTSNWQGHLSKTFGMTSVQMMFGVNLFSTLFTAASLFIQGGFWNSFEFAIEHPPFVLDCIVLSLCGAIGQLFIYYTIAQFGPVVFTIIMTLRQAIAILLSCIIYQHNISSAGILGIFVVFFAIFLRYYGNHRLKTIRRNAELAAKGATQKPRLSLPA